MNPNSIESDVFNELFQVCSAFFENLKRKDLVSRILEAGIQLTNSDRGSVFLADEGGKLTSYIATGMNDTAIHVHSDQGVVGHVFKTSVPIIINNAQDDPRFYSKIDKKTGYVTKTILSVPLRTPTGKTLGVVEVLNSTNGKYSERDVQILQIISLFAAVALEHLDTLDILSEANEKLKQGYRNSLQEIEQYKLQSSNSRLQELYERLPELAHSDSSLLIDGESGTGKEIIARLIHVKSSRKNKPFIAINCAAIPESLFEAELFGVAKGAATGTVARKGKFELVNGGTLFLDEIGEMPLSMQVKLLRVLQERTVTRVGSEENPKRVDFRLLAATNRDLNEMVKEGTFREDLFYRINVVQFHLPALRERIEDIDDLCKFVLNRFVLERGWKPRTLSPEAVEKLKNYQWPGNIRQLQNKLEAAVILSRQRLVLEPQDFQLEATSNVTPIPVPAPSSYANMSLKEAKSAFEISYIENTLKQTGGNKTQAAKILGITREGLRKALQKKAA